MGGKKKKFTTKQKGKRKVQFPNFSKLENYYIHIYNHISSIVGSCALKRTVNGLDADNEIKITMVSNYFCMFSVVSNLPFEISKFERQLPVKFSPNEKGESTEIMTAEAENLSVEEKGESIEITTAKQLLKFLNDNLSAKTKAVKKAEEKDMADAKKRGTVYWGPDPDEEQFIEDLGLLIWNLKENMFPAAEKKPWEDEETTEIPKKSIEEEQIEIEEELETSTMYLHSEETSGAPEPDSPVIAGQLLEGKLLNTTIPKNLGNGYWEASGLYDKAPGFVDPVESSLEIYSSNCTDFVKSYVTNLNNSKASQNIIRYEFCMADSKHIILVLEKYEITLDDAIKQGKIKDLWDESVVSGEVQFSEFLQDTILQILDVIDSFINKGIRVDELTTMSIVYAKGDEFHSTPKLRHLFGVGKKTDTPQKRNKHYFGKLRSLILEIMEVTNVYETLKDKDADENKKKRTLARDVGHLLQLLWVDHATLNLKHIKEHPAFWRPTEKLQLIIDVRNDYRLGKSYGIIFEEYFVYDYLDWTKKVKTNPILNEFYERSLKKRKESGVFENLENTMYHLTSFFRHAYEHINEKDKEAKKQENEEAKEQENKKGDDLAKFVSPKQLEGLLDLYFPNLATFIYGKLAAKDISWRPFRKMRSI